MLSVVHWRCCSPMEILINFNHWELFSVLEEKLYIQKRKVPFRCLRSHNSRRRVCQRYPEQEIGLLIWRKSRFHVVLNCSIAIRRQLSIFYYRGPTCSYKRLTTFSFFRNQKNQVFWQRHKELRVRLSSNSSNLITLNCELIHCDYFK